MLKSFAAAAGSVAALAGGSRPARRPVRSGSLFAASTYASSPTRWRARRVASPSRVSRSSSSTRARGDGRYARLLKTIARVDLLVLDDWGLATLTAGERRDLLEILDDRHGRKSTLVPSQLPVDAWHAVIGDPTLAEAILDRLVHNAHRLELRGDSMRKRAAPADTLDPETRA